MGNDSVEVPGLPNRKTDASISSGLSIFLRSKPLGTLDAAPVAASPVKKAGSVAVEVEDKWGLGRINPFLSSFSLICLGKD